MTLMTPMTQPPYIGHHARPRVRMRVPMRVRARAGAHMMALIRRLRHERHSVMDRVASSRPKEWYSR